MNEIDLYESMQNLNPSVDRLGKERDFKDSIIQCIKHLENRVKELERILNEKAK